MEKTKLPISIQPPNDKRMEELKKIFTTAGLEVNLGG